MNEKQAKLQYLKNKQKKQATQSQSEALIHKELIDTITELKDGVDSLRSAIDHQPELDTSELEASIAKLDKSVANIKIVESKVDLNPIVKQIKAIKNVVNVPEVPTKVIKQTDIFEIYKPADTEEIGSSEYYGYLAKDGKWFIMRVSDSNGSKRYRYATGTKQYDFSNKEKLSYKYINELDL